MKRRRLIAIISLCTLAGIALLLVIGGAVMMRTDAARKFVQGSLQAAIKGSVYIGRISGNPLAGITIDSLAIRDTTGQLLISTGRLSVDYDIRDLMDTRIHLRHVVVEHPHIHLRDFGKGKWNYQLLKSRGSGSKGTGRSWGSFVVLDSIQATNATFFLTMPWTPDDTLRGAVRDSVVRSQLARKDRLIERTSTGFTRTYMWTRGNALLTHARLADPDSVGQEFHIAALDANEFDPPFRFRNVRGVVRRLGDSAWLDIAAFRLPGSRGSAKGKVVWGSDLPIRYDLVVRGDSVALADVNWVYPTLPTTGGGRMLLRISNKRNIKVMDYHIDSMNVRSTGSHLIGEMTFGVGGGLLQIRNVNMRANPLDFELIKTLNGKPFPINWRGQIIGDVRAPGGPVNDFIVASARAEWRDTNVPGAVSRMTGSGGLNIQYPAFTAFHDFDVDVQTLDLRSITHLFPAFPRLNGTIAGTATLDSVWTDVRFTNADITHRDGPGTPSRFTGMGRVTDGSPYITYDLDLVADPISFDMLARSFPGLTLKGLAYGSMKITGQSPNLQIATNLVSSGGALRFAGNIDIDSLGGYGARGVGEISKVNLAQLGMRPNAPTTSLSGSYVLDVRGSTPSTLTGTADLRLGRSTYERITLDSTSRATLRFDRGRVSTTDSLVIESPFGRVSAFGALGLPGSGGIDSVNVTLRVDSLGQLRPYFTAEGQPTAPADSLGGTILVNGIARGSLDSLFVSGRVSSDALFVRGSAADSLRGTFSFADVLRAPSGLLNATLFNARVGGLEFDTVATVLTVLDTTRATFAVTGKALSGDSLSLASAGGWTRLAGATSVRVDSFALGFGSALWRLEQPATLSTDATALRIDSVGLRSARGATIGLAGVAPVSGPIDLRFSAARVPLFDLDRVVGQVQAPISGLADLSARMTGTRDFPVIDAEARLDSIALSGVQVGRLLGTAHYANRWGTLSADIFQADKRVLQAVADSLPLAIRWLTYDTLPGRVRARAVADGADFTLIQAAVDNVSHVTGKVFGSASLDGTWRRPNISGDATLVDGAMRIDTLGISLSKMASRMTFQNDTLKIDSLTAVSGGDSNSARITGLVSFRDWTLDWFKVQMDMNDFLAYNRPELAEIFARTNPNQPVEFYGRPSADTLQGDVYVNRGAIFLPDPKLVPKRFSALDSAGFLLAPRQKTLFDRLTDNLFTNLSAHIGGDFKLSADYADIPLSGDLSIVAVSETDVASRSSDYISRIAPVGTINANGGTYTLVFPPFIRRDFAVQRGGTITFDRDAQWNGVLNVSARYVVRKPGRPEVPITIQVTERLLSPKVRPISEASFQISDSDLISYILIGEPGFDVMGQDRQQFAQNLGENVMSSVFAPIATSATAEILRQKVFGRWLDQFRFETSGVDAQNSATSASFLNATRFTGGKEFKDGRIALSLSAGLCSFDQDVRATQGFGQSLAQQLGGNFDFRLGSSLTTGSSLQLSTEPGTKDLFCSQSSTTFGVAPTPRQYSLSFLKFWRW